MKLDAETVLRALAEVLREKFRVACERRKTFPWLRHRGTPLVAAAYFPPPLHCLAEFDPAERLNRDRGRTLERYPVDVPLGFDFVLYRQWCAASAAKADARSRRQAEHDVQLDLLPPRHGLNPTLRLAEPEIRQKIVGRVTGDKLRAALESLLEKRLSLHPGTTFLKLLEHPSGKPFVPRIGP